jgi:uncharacterized membrane protein YfcA
MTRLPALMAEHLIQDPLFYLLAVPVVLWVGISKGGFGGGAGMVAVPLLALSVPLPQAAAVLLPILCTMDLFALAAYRGQYSAVNIRRLLPAALVGIAAGALAFGTLDERWLRVIVGVIAVVFVLQWVVGVARHRGRTPEPTRPGVLSGSFWGFLTGFTSTMAHAGGPPVSVYLLPQRLPPTIFVGTTVILFTAVNYTKLIPYAWLGQLRTENLLTSLVLLPLAPLGIRLGRWLHDRVDDVLFYRITYVLLLVTGVKLIAEGLG